MSDRQTAVRRAVDQLCTAIVAGDGAALEALITDDFIGVGYSGATIGKRLYVDIHADPGQGEGAFTLAEVNELHLIERADTVVAHGVQHLRAKIDLTSRFIHLWREEAGAMRCFFYQETGIEPAP